MNCRFCKEPTTAGNRISLKRLAILLDVPYTSDAHKQVACNTCVTSDAVTKNGN